MFTVLLAALALAGAPANTHVVCGAPVPQNEQGWTWWNQDPPEILLGSIPCAAMLYASASPAERAQIRALNPTLNLDGITGAGLTVLLHEAVHAGGDHDETDTQCQAMVLLPQLLQRLGLPDDEVATALRVAHGWDAQLPAMYHTHAC